MTWKLLNPLGLAATDSDVVQRVYSEQNEALAVRLRELGARVEREGGRLAPLITSGVTDWPPLLAQTIPSPPSLFDEVIIVVDRRGSPPSELLELSVEGMARLLEAAVAPRWPRWELRACGQSDVSVFGRFFSGDMTSVSVAVDKRCPASFVVRGAAWFGFTVGDIQHLG